MADPYDPMKDPAKHAAPGKTLVDKVIELALSAGGGAVTLLSGLLAAALIMYSGYVLFDSFATERAASSNAWDLLRFKPEIFDDVEAPLNASGLTDINKDYRAWLTVYDTPIDYPVVQGPNDTYYASRDIYNRVSITGAIYLAAANSPDFSDSYNVIYGHHMANGAMFGALDHMTGSETGVIITDSEIYDVRFFAVATTDAYEHEIYNVGNRMIDVLSFLQSGGEGGVGVGTTVTYFNEEVAADATKVVALSTCADAETSGRLVVFGSMKKRIITVDLTIRKVWDDADDQDGLRPDSLTVTLSNGDTAELSEANGWTATLTVPKYDSRGVIPYTWSEEDVDAYTMTDLAYDEETLTTTLTNSYTPAVTSVSVRKMWSDGDDRDRLRPESVTAVLSNGMRVPLNEENNWTATVGDLPVYDHGTPIAYTWTEEAVSGYELTVDGDTLTNTHSPATTGLSVAKVWNDGGNQDGIRPDTVRMVLYGNDALIGSVTLNEDNGWTDAIDGLFVYEAGVPIAYRWEEAAVPGYTAAVAVNGTVTTITNTHIPETVDLTVSKIWDDNDNQDGIRPDSLRVTLSNGLAVTLSEANGWSGTVTDQPRYAAGSEIRYTWTEESVAGYTQTGSAVNGYSTVITNRHETDTTVATVIKAWNDDGDRDGVRPASVTVTLSTGEQRVLNAQNNWSATITGLPVNAAGRPITYTWTEEDVAGYTLSSEVSGTTTTLTNTHGAETANLTVTKVWDDNGDQDGIRPESIDVTLMANGDAVKTFTLDAGSGWAAVAADQPVNANGKPIDYSWSEQPLEGYSLSTAVTGNATTLTNTHTPEETALTVVKVWKDNENQDGIRPDRLTVTLSNGRAVVLTASNDWTASVDHLPVYANGTAIEYTWTEENVEGYTSAADVSGNVTTITNTHVPASAALTVRKEWDDDQNRDRMRPSTLAVNLMANSTVIRTTTLNDVNSWTAAFDQLPVYRGGEEIAYTWTEETVNGYELTTSADGTVTTLTNKHTPAAVELTVRKLWDDDDDRDAIRPDSVAVTLKGDNGTERVVTLSEGNDWTDTVSVPVYERGVAVGYTWKEENISGYRSVQVTEGNTTTITNTHAPATVNLTVRKVWDDADDQDGVRPETLTVYLTADHIPIRTVTLSGESGWTYTAEKLPMYENGRQISYGWREDKAAAYPTSRMTSRAGETVFTNTHEPEITTVSVRKVWNDANDQDGLRPASLTVRLMANGSPAGTVELNAANDWSGSIADLPVNANGSAIAYTWEEDPVEGYTRSTATAGFTTVITNTHETALTVATAVKVWDDDEDRDGLRPETLTITLNTGDQVILSAENGWTGTVENLPKNSGGSAIVYTWTEESIPGYEMVGAVTAGTVTTITNRHDITTADRTVTKVWDDANNRDGLRPEKLFVTINASQTVELNEDNGWTASVKNLPVYMNGGKRIIYTWKETLIEGYTLTDITTENGFTTLTNRHETATVTHSVTKVWNDSGNRDGLRPTALNVTLNANGTAVGTVTLNAANSWTAAIDDLPVYDEGSAIEYTWTEAAVKGYTQTDISTVTNADGVVAATITNTHWSTGIDLTVTKVWVDEDDDARPASLHMVLTGSDGEIRMAALSAANNWTATLTGLPKYRDGKEITYTWIEPAVAGYTQTSVVTNGTTTVFTNTRNAPSETPEDHLLTIHYRYPDGGTVAPDYEGAYREGDPYDIASPFIEGFGATPPAVTGTMPGRDVEVTVIYLPDGTTTIETTDTPMGPGHININVGDCLE